MNKISFTVEPKELTRALGVVALVSPQVATQQERGFLFVVQGEACRVYSYGNNQEVRASFPISGVEGEGAFIYPADFISEFEMFKGPIQFTAEVEGDSYKVSCKSGPAGSERVTFNPGIMADMEKRIQEALSQTPNTYNVNLLKDALNMAKGFVSTDKNGKELHKMVQIFGDDTNPDVAKGNGTLYASDGTQSFYYKTDPFVGKGLVIPGPCISLLDKFLSKSSGNLSVFSSERGFYFVNERSEVIGWHNRADTYKKFSYYHKDDTIIALVDVSSILDQLRFMRRAVASDRSKIRMHFDPEAKTLSFSSADENNKSTSYPITIDEIKACKVTAGFTANVNVDHMINLFTGHKGARVEFRIMVVEGQSKPVYMLRTIDEFYTSEDGLVVGGPGMNVPEGAHACVVTRFTPSIA